MCRLLEEMQHEAKLEERKTVALKMLKSGKLTIEEISDFSGLTVDQVKSLGKNLFKSSTCSTPSLKGMDLY